jgi:hypothetical protein
MTKTLKDYFKEFEDKVVGIETISKGLEGVKIGFRLQNDSARLSISNNFSLIQRFIKAQPLENQRELWLTTIDLLNASKAFNDEIKEERREELLVDCFKELENLNNTILQLQTQKTTTKPDEKFNWQGEQAQLVYLIQQLYEHGFLSPILQPDKHRLTAQHFTVKGESLNQNNLANTKRNNLNNKSGKPKGFEKIDQIISAAKNQNP